MLTSAKTALQFCKNLTSKCIQNLKEKYESEHNHPSSKYFVEQFVISELLSEVS